MEPWPDPALVSLFGSRARVLTIAALANSAEPLTGYRISFVTGVPRPKVYGELWKGVHTGIIREDPNGFVLIDADIRALLRRRVRVSWDEEWDRARGDADATIGAVYERVLASLPDDPEFYRPRNWKPTAETVRCLRSKIRPPEKDRILREEGGRTSYREGWKP